MKCPECGNEVGSDEKFCGNCGAPLEAAEEPELAPSSEFSGDETVIAEAEAFSLPDAEPPPETPAFEAEPPETGGEPEFVPLPPSPPPPPPAAEGRDNKKTWIIVAIVAAVLLLCCCCIIIIVGLLFTEAGQDLLYELSMQTLPSLVAIM